MFVNDSDHVKNRKTSEDLTEVLKKNLTNVFLDYCANGLIGCDLAKILSKK